MRINLTSPEASIPTASTASNDKQLKKACSDFETMLMNMVMKSMRKTVVKSDLFGSDKEEECFQEMMDSEMCQSATKSNNLGIADMMYRQLKGEQATANSKR